LQRRVIIQEMKKKNADAVILAAGLSARFPGFKPLLKIGNRTLIEKTIDSLDNICSNIIIVCGHRADDVINAVKNYSKVVTVINKDYLEGMFGSVIEGVKNGTGKIINSESEVGGYPSYKTVYRKFNPQEWDLTTMTMKNQRPF